VGMGGDSLGNQLANPVHTEEGLINLFGNHRSWLEDSSK